MPSAGAREHRPPEGHADGGGGEGGERGDDDELRHEAVDAEQGAGVDVVGHDEPECTQGGEDPCADRHELQPQQADEQVLKN